VLLVTGLAFLLRVQGLAYQSLWRDEVDSLRFAAQPLSELLRGFTAPGHNGPLYYLLLRPWLAAAGDSEFSLRFISLLAGVVAVPMVYRLGQGLVRGSGSAPAVASLLVAVSPYLVWYSQEGRMYAAAVVLVLGSLACLFSAAQSGGWRPWFGYVALTAAAFYTHILTALMIPVHLTVIALLPWPRAPKTAVRHAAALVALAILYIPLAMWQLPRLLDPGATGFAFVPLPQMLASMASTYVGGVAPSGVLLSELGLLALIGAALVFPRRDRLRVSFALAAWVSLPVVGLFLLTLRQPMYAARYLVFVLPGLLLLAGSGWRALALRLPTLSIVLVVLLAVSGLVGVGRQAAIPVKADLRSASRYVSSNMEGGDRVLFQIPYTSHGFEYYLRRAEAAEPNLPSRGAAMLYFPLAHGGVEPSWRIDGPFTNQGVSESEVDSLMVQRLGDARVVWFVASEVELWDERLLVQGWLFRHARITVRAEFAGVSVYRCELP